MLHHHKKALQTKQAWRAFSLSGNSTHSMRSATTSPTRLFRAGHGFNPRTPCGVRPQSLPHSSINTGFNPRTPCGVRRPIVKPRAPKMPVSIHALRVECDAIYGIYKFIAACFNPRTPCGVRPASGKAVPSSFPFQSTHSVWSATPCNHYYFAGQTFQSTHSVWSATGRF